MENWGNKWLQTTSFKHQCLLAAEKERKNDIKHLSASTYVTKGWAENCQRKAYRISRWTGWHLKDLLWVLSDTFSLSHNMFQLVALHHVRTLSTEPIIKFLTWCFVIPIRSGINCAIIVRSCMENNLLPVFVRFSWHLANILFCSCTPQH